MVLRNPQSRRRRAHQRVRHLTRRKSRTSNTIQVASPLQTVSPGDDFYRHINGAWLSKITIPPWKTSYGISEQIEDSWDQDGLKLLDRCKKAPSSKLEETVGDLARCVEDLSTRKPALETLKQILATVQTLSSVDEVAVLLGEFIRYHIPSLLILITQYEQKNTSKYSLVFGTGSLGLPDPSFYLTKSLKRGTQFALYKRMLKRLGGMLGLPQLACVVRLERVLAGVLAKTHEDTIDTKLTGSELQKRFPKIPFGPLLEAAGLSSWSQRVYFVESMRWMSTVNSLFANLGLESWKLILSQHLILFSLPWLPDPFERISFQFYRKQLRGQQHPLSLPKKALYVVQQYATPLYSRLFVKEVADPSQKTAVQELLTEVLSVAENRVGSVEWLAPKTRRLAQEKVARMRSSVGYPDRFPEISLPTLTTSDMLVTLLELGAWQRALDFEKLGTPRSQRKDWEDSVFVVNAYYYEQANEMILPYGIFAFPFFDQTRPFAWNYGGLGCVICHEITHAFDEEGKEYAPDGTQNAWWLPQDLKNYKTQTKGLIDLVSKQRILGFPVNGKKTVSENIADLGGMGIALDALKKKLDSLQLTKEEREAAYRDFFTAYAMSWRIKVRRQKQIQALITDRHAPASLRVNLIVSQFQEWYDAFGVKEGDALYIPPEKRLRIF